tara:strand:- start:527 stop:1003 length:477 start_codon:yes stop_codon:yes gene_type:complete
MSEFFVYPEDTDDEVECNPYLGDRLIVNLSLGISKKIDSKQISHFRTLCEKLIKQITKTTYGITYDWKNGTWISEDGWNSSSATITDGGATDLTFYEEDLTLEINIPMYENDYDYDYFNIFIKEKVASIFAESMLPIKHIQLLRTKAKAEHFTIDTTK